jgi:hypothetical protein
MVARDSCMDHVQQSGASTRHTWTPVFQLMSSFSTLSFSEVEAECLHCRTHGCCCVFDHCFVPFLVHEETIRVVVALRRRYLFVGASTVNHNWIMLRTDSHTYTHTYVTAIILIYSSISFLIKSDVTCIRVRIRSNIINQRQLARGLNLILARPQQVAVWPRMKK